MSTCQNTTATTIARALWGEAGAGVRSLAAGIQYSVWVVTSLDGGAVRDRWRGAFPSHLIAAQWLRQTEVAEHAQETERPETCVMQRAMTTRQSDRRRYRVIAASLRPEDVETADRIAAALREEGWPHANRSLVIREALSALGEILKDRSTDEIFRHFIERRGRRIPTSAKPNPAA